jgi:pimeloyl-ACP methyl ester carboxylesterase
MPFFDSDGLKIHYEDRGSGDPAVLVHGFASNAKNNWGVTGWLDLLARDHRVVALDCRGHGLSDKPHERAAYTATSMEDDVIALMDHAAIGRTLLMGYSMGGRISMGMLVRYPERFRAVVLGGIGQAVAFNNPARRASIVEGLLAADASSVNAEIAKQFRRFAESNRNDLKALAACMDADRSTIGATAFANNRVPVLLAVGSKDTVVGSTRALATTIRNSRLVEIEGRDHLNTPGDKRYKETVLEFFASAPP